MWPDYVCVDVGANIGYYTCLLAQLCQSVHAFEPLPDNMKWLYRNITTNKYTNVTLHPQAVSNYTGMAKLYPSYVCTGMNRTFPSKYCQTVPIAVNAVKLDTTILHADFIKIDVEGDEAKVLSGAGRLLKSVKAIIIEHVEPDTEVESLLYDFKLEQIGWNLVGRRNG